MGSGVSKDNVYKTFEAELKTNPEETIKIVEECANRIRQRRAKEQALALAKQYEKFARPSRREISKSFEALDWNQNGLLSLAEIDKYVTERFPKLDNKPALMRAYKASDVNGDGFITEKEYDQLWSYIELFTRFWHIFEEIDYNGDRRIEMDEFITFGQKIFGGTTKQLRALFQKADADGKGMVLFAEFCALCVRRL
jgi:Ca2+-binding EF-hand superfamily protein